MLLGRRAGYFSVFLLFMGGCTTMSMNAGFTEVSTLVEERNATKLFWNNGTDLDKEAAEKLRSLLKEKLTVDGAVQIALLNNRELQAVYSDLGVAQADLVQAGLLKNPIFEAEILFPLAHGGRPDLELSAVMSFLDVFYMPLRKRVAAARFEAAKLRVSGAVLDLAAQVRRTYYVHQSNEQMVELRKTILEALGISFDVARRLHEAGNMSDLDFFRQRALLETVKLELASAELAVLQSREQLTTLMGLWGQDTNWELEGRMPEIPKEPISVTGIETVALQKSLELNIAWQRIMAAGEELGFSKWNAFLPELHGGPRGVHQERSWTEVGPVIEFPLPLFDQGQGQVGRTASQLRRAQQEYYALALRIRSAARTVRDRMQATRDRALFVRDIMLPLRERVLNELQLQYNAMQFGVFQLLRAREQQIETAVSYIESLRDYWLARTDLSQILMGRLPAGNGVPAGQNGSQPKMEEPQGH